MAMESTLVLRPKDHFYALVAYEDAYVHPLIVSALESLFPPEAITMLSKPPTTAGSGDDDAIPLSKLLPDPRANVLQITQYEAIDWDFVDAHPESCLVNSYMLRKALIRKHYLAATVEHWIAKRPLSVLKDHVKRAEAFEVDYAEFLDDALVEAFDLRASLDKNQTLIDDGTVVDGENDRDEGKVLSSKGIEWWILKPGMSDRGQGIRLFCTMAQLQDIFDGWEAERPDSDDEEGDDEEGDDEEGDDEEGDDDDENESGGNDEEDGGDYITTSQLRHFVAQPYIDSPLLLPSDGRKFHIRTYVACVGSLDVYVYKPMLALFAGKPYVAPKYKRTPSSPLSDNDDDGLDKTDDIDLDAHLTNTCLQRSVMDGTVRPFWELSLPRLPSQHSADKEEVDGINNNNNNEDDAREYIFRQICEVTGEVFEAAARSMQMHFRPLTNAFELFGLDFLVDASGRVYLLEVNAFPDFRQTGDELKELVAGLWKEVLGRAVGGFFVGQRERRKGSLSKVGEEESDQLVLVKRVNLGQ